MKRGRSVAGGLGALGAIVYLGIDVDNHVLDRRDHERAAVYASSQASDLFAAQVELCECHGGHWYGTSCKSPR